MTLRERQIILEGCRADFNLETQSWTHHWFMVIQKKNNTACRSKTRKTKIEVGLQEKRKHATQFRQPTVVELAYGLLEQLVSTKI